MKKKLITFITIVFFILGILNWRHSQLTSLTPTPTPTPTSTPNNNSSHQENKTKRPNKMCDWIDKSAVILKLDLPEKYAHYNEPTVFPSYDIGFQSTDDTGLTYSNRKLARKQCNYRVGFSEEDMQAFNFPLTIIAYKNTTDKFSFESKYSSILNQETLDSLPHEIILKVSP